MKKKKRGFTLVELGVSIGIVGSLAVINAQETKFQSSQDKARALGNEIFLYNSAVSRFLAANAGDSGVVGVFSGSDWLKADWCSGGVSDEGYLDCNMMPENRTIQYQILPVTTIDYSSEGNLSARTLWETVVGESGSVDTMAMGIAALTASGNYISQQNDAASGYQHPTVYCPSMSTISASIAGVCGYDRNVIISSSGISSSVDPWLRTDHGNTMRHAIEFNPSGDISTESELRSVEDRDGGSWLRQILNASRVYNGTGSDGESITIGAREGGTIYSDLFLAANSLLEGSVILDGDVGVMNDIYIKASAFVNGNLEVDGGAEVTGTITSRSHIYSDGNMVSEGSIFADNGSMRSRRFIDSDDISTFIDPSERSQITSLTASSDIRAARFYDQKNTDFYVDPSTTSVIRDVEARDISARDIEGRIFRDSSNPGVYRLQPSSFSRMQNLRVDGYSDVHGRITARDGVRLLNNTAGISPGGSCTPNGLVARSSTNGQMVNCVSGTWRASGIGSLNTYTAVATNGFRSSTATAYCAAGYRVISGGCRAHKSTDFYIRETRMVSGGWRCSMVEDYGSDFHNSNYQLTAYAYCIQ